MYEADTTHEWQEDVVRRFLSLRQPTAGVTFPAASLASKESGLDETIQVSGQDFDNAKLELAAKGFAEALSSADLDALAAYWKTMRGLPSEQDRRLLPAGRTALGRDLNGNEKRFIRSRVQQLASERIARGPGQSDA